MIILMSMAMGYIQCYICLAEGELGGCGFLGNIIRSLQAVIIEQIFSPIYTVFLH